MNKFQNDLKFGSIYERETLKYFDYDDYKFNNDYRFDIIFNDNLKVEVKADRLAHKTNNICIEFKYNNNDSGINKTESSRYFYYIIKPDNTYDIYNISVKKIKKYILKEKYKKIVNSGDKAKSYLFDLSVFEKYKLCNLRY